MFRNKVVTALVIMVFLFTASLVVIMVRQIKVSYVPALDSICTLAGTNCCERHWGVSREWKIIGLPTRVSVWRHDWTIPREDRVMWLSYFEQCRYGMVLGAPGFSDLLYSVSEERDWEKVELLQTSGQNTRLWGACAVIRPAFDRTDTLVSRGCCGSELVITSAGVFRDDSYIYRTPMEVSVVVGMGGWNIQNLDSFISNRSP